MLKLNLIIESQPFIPRMVSNNSVTLEACGIFRILAFSGMLPYDWNLEKSSNVPSPESTFR